MEENKSEQNEKKSEQKELKVEKRSIALKVLGDIVTRHFLPLGTLLVIPFGIFVPRPAVFLSEKLPVMKICVVTIFFMFGLKFRLTEVKSALRSYKEVAFGLVSVLFVTPLIGVNILKLVPQFGEIMHGEDTQQADMTGNINNANFSNHGIFGAEEFRIGLQLLCIAPSSSTLSTVIVGTVNGNTAVSLLTSILCTIVAVFTVPLMFLIPAVQKVSSSFASTLLNIILLIFLPLLVGRLLRFVSIVKKTVVTLNKPLKFLSLSALLVIFSLKISEASANGNFRKFSPWIILAVTALGTGIVCIYLVVSFVLLSLLPGFSKKSTLTLTILSCTRNLCFTATVIDLLPDSIGDKSLMFFPAFLVFLATIIILNTFAYVMKVEDDVDHKSDCDEFAVVADEPDIMSYTNKAIALDTSEQCDTSYSCSGDDSAVRIDVLCGDGDAKETVAVAQNFDDAKVPETTLNTNKNIEAFSTDSSAVRDTHDPVHFTATESRVCIDVP